MIFQRALVRELTGFAGAVFMTLSLIVITTRLVRLLGQAAGGKVPTDTVVAFLGFFYFSVLPMLLSLTLFVTVLLVLTRSYRDSEMVIWFNSGLSLADWIKPVLSFAMPLVLLIAVLSTWASPWAAQKSEEYRSRIDNRDEVSRVTPGVFGESSSKDRVFFVESVVGDATQVRNVFVSSVQLQRPGIMVSATGHVEVADNGDRFLVLENGRRYEGVPGETDYRVMAFERYATRIEVKEGDGPVATQRELSTLELMRLPTPQNLGELVWRLGVPVLALILSLLAIPMSFVNPRAGRSIHLLLAMLTFMVYSNLLSLMQVRVAQGKLYFGLGVWVIHVVMFMVVVTMFAHRMGMFQRIQWKRQRA